MLRVRFSCSFDLSRYCDMRANLSYPSLRRPRVRERTFDEEDRRVTLLEPVAGSGVLECDAHLWTRAVSFMRFFLYMCHVTRRFPCVHMSRVGQGLISVHFRSPPSVSLVGLNDFYRYMWKEGQEEEEEQEGLRQFVKAVYEDTMYRPS